MGGTTLRHSRRSLLRGGLALAGLGLLGGCGVPVPWAQSGSRPARIAWLASGNPTAMGGIFDALRQGLRDLGYEEGQNLLIEARWAEDRATRLPELAQEVVQLLPDVIVAQGPQPSLAAKAATATIPIVAVSVSDPVGIGLAASLAHPGGNVTGLTLAPPDLAAKRIQLLKEAAPGLTRVAFFWDPGNPTDSTYLTTARQAAPALDLTLLPFEVPDQSAIAPAFAQALAQGADGATFHAGSVISCCIPQIVALTVQQRLPTMFPYRLAEDGLMSYAADPLDNYRRAAAYVDRILKGARSADLPIEQPTKYDFVINLKTAQALGLTIPASVLQQATEIIQ